MNTCLEGRQKPEASIEELSGAVLGEIKSIIAASKGDRRLKHMLLEPILALAGSKDHPTLRRSFLTLVVCKALCSQTDRALPAAAAVELFLAALDVFDDIEDQDNEDAPWRLYGQAQALNAATALLMLAQSAIARLDPQNVDHHRIAQCMETIATAGTTACAGQHRDLEYESTSSITEAKYFSMTRMKSASLLECASRLGAIVAGAPDSVVEAFGLFGRYLGIAAQVTNDVESVGGHNSGKSDISKRKKTLPVIFAISNAEQQDRRWLAYLYGAKTPVDPDQEQRVLEILRRSGAIHYSLVRADLYRQKAITTLHRASLSGPTIRQIATSLSI